MGKASKKKRHEALMAVLRGVRTEAGLTQEEVSKRLGRAYNWTTKIETGERRLMWLDFHELAEVLGIEAPELERRIAERLKKMG